MIPSPRKMDQIEISPEAFRSKVTKRFLPVKKTRLDCYRPGGHIPAVPHEERPHESSSRYPEPKGGWNY